MVNLSNLPKIVKREKKRCGRGYGSGKGGHTSGRGTKGQKSRLTIPALFEGTKRKKSFVRRTPLRRGKGKFNPLSSGPVIINIKDLNRLPEKSIVTIDFLIKEGVVQKKAAMEVGVKILGGGQLQIPLTIKLPCSKSAVEKIKKAGGKLDE